MKLIWPGLFILVANSALAGTQIRTALNGPILTLKNSNLVMQGEVKSKTHKLPLSYVLIKGKVAGHLCGADNCLGNFSLNNRGEVILNARIDLENDGNIDFKESKVVGVIAHDEVIDLQVPAKYEYVEDRYTLLERLSGLKNKEYGALTVVLE